MAINTFPAVASPVKSVQRGSAAGAGTVTITAIDISKSMVNIQGTTSSGTVAASASIGGTMGSALTPSMTFNPGTIAAYGGTYNGPGQRRGPVTGASIGGSIGGNMNSSLTISGGTNNLIAAQIQGYLSNSTSLVVSGACRWEVVEFN